MVSVRTLAKVIEQLLSKESPASGSLWECFRSPLEAFVRLREIQDENGEGGIDEASDREEGETNNDDEGHWKILMSIKFSDPCWRDVKFLYRNIHCLHSLSQAF